MGADQVDKADPGQLLDLVFALHQLHQLQDLPAPVTHRHDQKTGIGQLCEQGFGHFGAGGGDDNATTQIGRASCRERV